MMRPSFLLLVFITSSFTAISQSKVTVGKPYVAIEADSKTYFSGNGEILAIKIQGRSITLQKMNATTLTLQKTKTYEDFPKGFHLEGVIELKKHYYFLYSLWENSLEQLFYREIDFSACSFKSEGKKLITVTEKLTGNMKRTGFMRGGVFDKFNFFYSYDTTKLAIEYRTVPTVSNDKVNYDVVGLHVFDTNLKEQWGKKVKMPYTEQKMDDLNYTVDTQGNVYIVARVFNDNSTDLKKKDEDVLVKVMLGD